MNGPDVAISGVDEVVVAPGRYNEIIDFSGKAITLRSSDPTNPAVVAATTVLDGFTITGGTGDTALFGAQSPVGGGMDESAQINGLLSVRHIDVQGRSPAVGNINADPLFVNAGGGDFRLSVGSPCIDAGDSNETVAVGLQTDLDGNNRGMKLQSGFSMMRSAKFAKSTCGLAASSTDNLRSGRVGG